MNTPNPVHQAIHELAELRLPLFVQMRETGVIVPIAIGIAADVMARIDPLVSKTAKRSLAIITSSYQYQKAVREPQAMRHNIDGEPVEPVTDEARNLAKLRLKEMQERRAAARPSA